MIREVIPWYLCVLEIIIFFLLEITITVNERFKALLRFVIATLSVIVVSLI